MSLTFTGELSGHAIKPDLEALFQRLENWNGFKLIFHIDKFVPARSSQANRLDWLWNTIIGEHFGTSKETMQYNFKKAFFGYRVEPIGTGKNKLLLEIPDSSKDKDKFAFMEYMDFKFRIASDHGIILPE